MKLKYISPVRTPWKMRGKEIFTLHLFCLSNLRIHCGFLFDQYRKCSFVYSQNLRQKIAVFSYYIFNANYKKLFDYQNIHTITRYIKFTFFFTESKEISRIFFLTNLLFIVKLPVPIHRSQNLGVLMNIS